MSSLRGAGSSRRELVVAVFPRVPAMPSRKRPIQQSSVKEQRLIEDVVRGKKGTATDALHRVNELRRKHGIRGIGMDAVYRFV